jgi:hypothetical protein
MCETLPIPPQRPLEPCGKPSRLNEQFVYCLFVRITAPR